jgi:hypothetical protein
VPVVGAREPCPCGSGKRYKACHGRSGIEDRRLVARPFAGLAGETEWVALREIVPSATAPLVLRDAPDRAVVLSTVLPLAWPALVRKDGTVLLGLQVQSRGNDVSRDLAHALELALQAEPGTSVVPTGLPGPGRACRTCSATPRSSPSCTAASSTGSRAAGRTAKPMWRGRGRRRGRLARAGERQRRPDRAAERRDLGVLVPDEGAHPPALGDAGARGGAARRAGKARRC